MGKREGIYRADEGYLLQVYRLSPLGSEPQRRKKVEVMKCQNKLRPQYRVTRGSHREGRQRGAAN